MFGRVGAGALLTIAAVLALAAPANAFWGETVTGSRGGYLTVHSEPGETNSMTVAHSPGVDASPGGVVLPKIGDNAIIHDSTATVTAPPEGRGSGCTKVDGHTLSCSAPDSVYGGHASLFELEVDLGDGDDSLTLLPGSTLSLVAEGGDGNDVITADDPLSGANLYGGAGDDRLTIRGAGNGDFSAFQTRGDAGDDVLDLVNGYDNNPSCGDGNDVLYADPGEGSPDCEQTQTVGVP